MTSIMAYKSEKAVRSAKNLVSERVISTFNSEYWGQVGYLICQTKDPLILDVLISLMEKSEDYSKIKGLFENHSKFSQEQSEKICMVMKNIGECLNKLPIMNCSENFIESFYRGLNKKQRIQFESALHFQRISFLQKLGVVNFDNENLLSTVIPDEPELIRGFLDKDKEMDNWNFYHYLTVNENITPDVLKQAGRDICLDYFQHSKDINVLLGYSTEIMHLYSIFSYSEMLLVLRALPDRVLIDLYNNSENIKNRGCFVRAFWNILHEENISLMKEQYISDIALYDLRIREVNNDLLHEILEMYSKTDYEALPRVLPHTVYSPNIPARLSPEVEKYFRVKDWVVRLNDLEGFISETDWCRIPNHLRGDILSKLYPSTCSSIYKFLNHQERVLYKDTLRLLINPNDLKDDSAYDRSAMIFEVERPLKDPTETETIHLCFHCMSYMQVEKGIVFTKVNPSHSAKCMECDKMYLD